MAVKYARAGGGAWATNSTWSTTSGGAADTTAPTTGDDAVIDANSGAVTAINGACDSLTVTNGAVKTTVLTFSGALTLSGAFSVTGNSAVNRIICQSTVLGTARTITAATTSLTNCDFRDITGAGAAAWTGTSIGDCGGNTGITADTPITCYRVGAGGNWSDSAWFTTSGGATPARVPLPQDTARIDANASGTVTNDMPRMGGTIDFTGYTGTFNTTTAPDIHGSLTLGSGMSLASGNRLTFRGRGSHTITSAGLTYVQPLNVDCASGTYALADAYACSASSSFIVTSGTFNDGGFSITLSGAAASFSQTAGTATLSGTTTITSTTAATPWSVTGGTLNHTGTIALTGNTTTARTFAGGSRTYHTLTDTNTNNGTLTITGANTFANLNKTATVACTLNLPDGVTTTITNAFNVHGQPGAVLTLDAA